MTERTLRVWLMPTHIGAQTSRIFFNFIEPFLKRNPGLSVALRLTPWNSVYSELIHAFKSGDPPDLFQIGTTWTGTLAYLGFITPVPDGLEDCPVLAPWIDGRRVALPWTAECSCLQARSDILEDMGITLGDLSTWDGFLDVCHRIGRRSSKGKEVDPRRPLPLALTCRPGNDSLHNVTSWLWAGGWRIPDLNAPPVYLLSDASIRPVWEYLSHLWQTSPLGKNTGSLDPNLIEDIFYNEGRFAFYNGYWWRILRRATGNIPDAHFRWPVQPIPFPAGPNGSVPRGGGAALAVSSRSKYPELAWDLARFLISEEFIGEWVKISGNAPAHDGSFWREYADSPEVAFIRRQIETARTYPSHPLWKAIEQFLFTGLSGLLWRFVQGKAFDQEAQELLRSTDEQINATLQLAWDNPLYLKNRTLS